MYYHHDKNIIILNSSHRRKIWKIVFDRFDRSFMYINYKVQERRIRFRDIARVDFFLFIKVRHSHFIEKFYSIFIIYKLLKFFFTK